MAVDAGVHLGAIREILKDTQPPDLGKTDELALPYILQTGPFAGLKVHSASPNTNAKTIQGDLVDTYLITHPHLDHISGFVINTSGLAGTKRKKLAGLPGTIQALKTHIFNDTIWPNLSDEDHGAGLFTYMRLNEGGSSAMGNPDGYLEFNEGLAVKVWSVSHGHHFDQQPAPRIGSGSVPNTRHGSLDASSGMATGMPVNMTTSFSTGMLSPRSIPNHNASPNVVALFQQQQQQQQLGFAHERANSLFPGSSMASGSMPSSIGRSAAVSLGGGSAHSPMGMPCAYDSSSYFIRDVETGVEVLIFGDVEGDSISNNPRNLRIWQEAAPKIVAGKLKAILIECSYDDSRPTDRLFGHLTPSFLIEELKVLADVVRHARTQAVLDRARELEDNVRRAGKRKRDVDDGTIARRRATRAGTRDFGMPSRTPPPAGSEPASPKTSKSGQADAQAQQAQTSQPVTLRLTGRSQTAESIMSPGTSVSHGSPQAVPRESPREQALEDENRAQLAGLKVVIIHMKDMMDDELPIEQVVLDELLDHEAEMIESGKWPAGLGCEFIISEVGMSLFL